MGIYYSAIALIGYKVSLAKLKTKTTVRSCDHATKGAKFCPECGTKVSIRQETSMADEWDELYELLLENCPEDITWNYDGEYNSDFLYIGYGTSAEPGDVSMVRIPPEEAIKALVAEVLEPYKDFLVMGEYGLYSIHYGR